jgi:ribosomal protein S27AE/predicted nucleic acid-binding Zn ribbon protein
VNDSKMTRPKITCRHCGLIAQHAARGLCTRCYKDKTIRAQYPLVPTKPAIVPKPTVCQNPGCNNPIPPGRRRFCSDKCARHFRAVRAQARQLEAEEQARLSIEPPDLKERTCMKCGKKFLSDGPGNRLCPKCRRQWEENTSEGRMSELRRRPEQHGLDED